MERSAEPSEEKYWGLGGTLLWGALIAAVFVLLQTATIMGILMLDFPDPSRAEIHRILQGVNENGRLISFATLATTIVCSAMVLGVVRLKRGAGIVDYLALRLPSKKSLWLWLGLLAGLIVVVDTLIIVSGKPIVPDFMSKTYATAQPIWLFWIALVICAPLFEELFFRGFLMRGLAQSFLKPAGAVIVTTLVWSVIHHQYDLYGIVIVFSIGLLLGTARVVSGSLLLPIAMHAAVNAIATLQTAYLTAQ